jgi:hypothetical protein
MVFMQVFSAAAINARLRNEQSAPLVGVCIGASSVLEFLLWVHRLILWPVNPHIGGVARMAIPLFSAPVISTTF